MTRKYLPSLSREITPIGESAEGTSPSAARRTVREPLDSHGSHHRAIALAVVMPSALPSVEVGQAHARR